MKIKVTVWNEFRHEREEANQKSILKEFTWYKTFLDSTGEFEVKTATLD